MMPDSPFLVHSSAGSEQGSSNSEVAGSSPAAPAISPDAALSSLPSGESEPSVMLASASGENPISALLELADSRFKLDIPLFMAAIEDVPLFLRRVG